MRGVSPEQMQTFAPVMRQIYKESHYGEILCKKQGQRTFKIKEDKCGCQKQVRENLILYKGIKSVNGSCRTPRAEAAF